MVSSLTIAVDYLSGSKIVDFFEYRNISHLMPKQCNIAIYTFKDEIYEFFNVSTTDGTSLRNEN